jgi:translation elongation factor EF-1beta
MTARIYNCKSEEVPVIGRYVSFSLKRDLADFAAYLPKLFTEEYVAGFEQKIDDVNNLLNPQSETVELKNTTNRLYSFMDSLVDPVDKVKGYIKFTKGAIPVSVKDFGLTALKRKVHSKDAEGVLKNLRTVIANIELYRSQLIEQGCDEKTIAQFSNALTEIEADNQRQFEIVSKRKTIVKNNVNLINDLYKTIMEICDVGKAIYKGKNELKVKDYTFTELRKSVRIVKS